MEYLNVLYTILLKTKPHKLSEQGLYSQQQHSLPHWNFAEFIVKLNMLLTAGGYAIHSLYMCYDFASNIKMNHLCENGNIWPLSFLKIVPLD